MEHLPEPLISHVLGFLPTKDAVRTSILSSEWKYRWTCIENLNFDDEILHLNNANIIMHQLKFVLLNKLRLKCSQCHDIPIINDLIYTSLSRYIKELDLHINWTKTHSLACGIFTCDTLAVLKLCVHTLDVPVSVYLPNLKVLHVEDTKLNNDESINRLLSSCPVLEDLALISCSLNDKFVLQISNPGLRKLVLNHNGYYKVKYSITLDVPKLLYFEFKDYIPQVFTVKNLDSLVEASVNFDTHRVGLSPTNPVFTKPATQIVDALSKVRSLNLSSDFTKAFIRLRIKFPEFAKLTKLEYGIDDIPGCCLLRDLIECAPKLESISLNFNNRFVPREYIPGSVWDQLKVVKRTVFIGNAEDLQFVKYILRNSNVLERLELYAADLYEPSIQEYKIIKKYAPEPDEVSLKEYEKLTKKLQTFKRASNVKYIVRKAKILKTQQLAESEASKEEYEDELMSRANFKNTTKELLNFRRASKSCKIVVR